MSKGWSRASPAAAAAPEASSPAPTASSSPCCQLFLQNLCRVEHRCVRRCEPPAGRCPSSTLMPSDLPMPTNADQTALAAACARALCWFAPEICMMIFSRSRGCRARSRPRPRCRRRGTGRGPCRRGDARRAALEQALHGDGLDEPPASFAEVATSPTTAFAGWRAGGEQVGGGDGREARPAEERGGGGGRARSRERAIPAVSATPGRRYPPGSAGSSSCCALDASRARTRRRGQVTFRARDEPCARVQRADRVRGDRWGKAFGFPKSAARKNSSRRSFLQCGTVLQ